MGNKRPPFKPDTVFHVYNHGNAEDDIFREEENYHYFLKRYAEYVYPIARTYAFCLLPNHFHLAVEIRSYKRLVDFFEEKNPEGLSPIELSNRISNQFGTFLNAYTKSFNNYYDRKGSLFRNTTNRKPITNKVYYKNLIAYIHQNPIEHGFVDHPVDWPFSSYQIILSRKETQLEREKVLNWFGGKETFVEDHKQLDEIIRDEFY